MAIGMGAITTALVGFGTAAPARRNAAAPERQAEAGATGCRCGHAAAAHEHFRPGSDCGVCGAASCARFRTARWPGRRWARVRRGARG